MILGDRISAPVGASTGKDLAMAVIDGAADHPETPLESGKKGAAVPGGELAPEPEMPPEKGVRFRAGLATGQYQWSGRKPVPREPVAAVVGEKSAADILIENRG